MTCNNCKLKAFNSAIHQNTIYDPTHNKMLYGINNHLKASGVSDGTCNQINPYIFTKPAMCGFGTAGGNPCYSVEPFENSGCNVSGFVTMLFLILILLLFININYVEKK
jgi:hypothetical protein